MRSVSINVTAQVSLKNADSFPLYIYPMVRLLNRVVISIFHIVFHNSVLSSFSSSSEQRFSYVYLLPSPEWSLFDTSYSY